MQIHRLVAVAAILSGFQVAPETSRAGQPAIELRLGDRAIEGRIVDKGKGWCVLYDRNGVMHSIDLDKVTRFKKVSSNFQPHSFNTLRTMLLKEFGKDFEVATSRHYVVCAPRGRSRTYCDLFEQTWRRFHMYFAIRGFRMDDPEFPMLAVVLKDRKSFLDYARKENAGVDSSILGYYWSTHNRVIMFEDQKSRAAIPGHLRATEERLVADSLRGTHSPAEQLQAALRLENQAWDFAFGAATAMAPDEGSLADIAARAGINTDLRETLVHEATHQLGYNLGLHNRTGRNSKWIVEGLATVFETPGMETHATDRDAKKRVNEGWLYGFRKFIDGKRPEAFLETFIRDDRFFETSMSNAYAQAWALSFWLIETRPRAYATFLQKMASADVAKRLTPDTRVRLFKEAFGDNLILLDAEMLRYYARLK